MYFETNRDKQHYYAKRDNICPTHFHRSIELLYVVHGEKKIVLDGREYLLTTGDLLVCPPYRIHTYPPCENTEQIVATVSAQVCPQFETLCQSYAPETPVFHDRTGELLPFMERLQDCKNEILFSGLVHYILGVYTENTKFTVKPKDVERPLLERIVAYVDENYAQTITLSSIAKQFGYSPNYFSTLFKKYFYASFTEYLNGVRVQKSVPLLKKHSVSSVYFLCGFNSPQQYFLHFKKFYGCSPKEFLKKPTK